MASSGSHIAPNSNAVSVLLAALNLHEYIDTFVANDIVTIPRLKAMQDVHYQRLGVSLGHQFDIIERLKSFSDSPSDVRASEFPLVGNFTSAPLVSSDPGRVRDKASGESHSKRQRTDFVGSLNSPVVEVFLFVCFFFFFFFLVSINCLKDYSFIISVGLQEE
jgi:hypothetical protein